MFSLILLTTLAYSFTLFATTPITADKTVQLQALARDYSRLKASGASVSPAAFADKTGFAISEVPPASPDAHIVARGVAFAYGNSCSGLCNDNCTVAIAQAGAADCLGGQLYQDISKTGYTEAWIVIP
jgi:hypothetical protein